MQRIVGVQDDGKRGGRGGVKVRPIGVFHTVDGIQRGYNLGARGVQSFIALALLFDENQDFIGLCAQTAVADALDFAVAQSLRAQTFADLVDVGGIGKPHVDVCAALKVDAVAKAVIEEDGSPAGKEQNCAEGVEILRFTHPVDVGFFKELDHATRTSLL